MRNTIRRWALMLLLAAAMLPSFGQIVVAQQKGPELVIAIVDVQKILENSKASKVVQTALEKQRTSFQNDISQQENTLRTADQDLLRQRANLSPEDYEKKRQDLEQKAATLRRDVQAKRQQLDRMFQTSMNTIRTALLQVIDEIAAERKATLVLSKNQVLLAAKEYDITEEAMKRLNAKLPTVAVELPN
ncbi:MAG: OmpH family outer membrane protein [Rhodospirillales bacterium]|nr:OmpH family outer membrane protein [Rhodospirillales bacterium]